MDFKEEEIKEFDNLSDKIDKDGLAPLIKSYAPEVEGFDIVKQALAIQASQRNNSNIEEESTKSHIGLFGDPGVSKSVLAKFTLGITIGSAYASGGGASGVGLTASVIKVENIGYVLKLGKLPMTKELLVLDEYNLVSDEDKPKLQEAFSEKKITINKAGISASPKVSCGSLCLANPIRGIFDNSQSLRQQFNLTHPQLNRFDALFIEQDEKDEGKDGRIVDIILKRKVGEIKAEYDIKFLRKFFTYTRNRAEPTLTEESQKELKKSYMKARGMTKNNEGVLINPRFLNALIRFATGNAKLRGSSEVLIKDVEVAYNILSASYLNLNKFEALK